MTIYDLAEQYNRSTDYVRGWLRKRGLLGRKDVQVSHAAVQVFKKAHNTGLELPSSAYAEPQAEVASPAQLPPQYRTPIAPPLPPPANPAVEGFYRKKHDELMTQYRAAQAQISELRGELTKAQRKPRVIQAPSKPVAPKNPTSAAPLGDVLEGQGFVGDARRSALRALVASPRGADALLSSVLAQPEAVRSLRPVCEDPTCHRVSTLDGAVAVRVSASRCAVCEGSPNRRWFGLMARMAVRAGKQRLLIIGGSDDSHAALNALAKNYPQLKMVLVEGDRKTNRQRARTKTRGADVVVFWASTLLDHAVSDVYKDAAEALPTVKSVVVPKGGRGIKSMARAVVEALDR